MENIKKIVIYAATSLLALLLVLVTFIWLRYGGGEEYADISTDPVYGPDQLELVYSHDEPVGNVAVSKDTTSEPRVFFTIHPESRPEKIKLMEVIDGTARPYPSEEAQSQFNTVLGVYTDQQNRLWTIDHGNHGFDSVKVIAFDLKTDGKVHEYIFPDSVAKKLSFFNDLSVSPDGKHLVVANVSFFGKKPSLAVYDIKAGESKNLLEGHSSVRDENYVPVTPAKKMSFFGGLVDLLAGIDGIDFSRNGKYVYYAAMGHSGLFRIPAEVITDFSRSKDEIAAAVDRVADKPLSDGIRTDFNGNIYITDIENRGVYLVTPEGDGFTLINDTRIRWADGLSVRNNGTIYLADSDIPNQMLQSKSHIKAHAPYHIYKFEAYGK